MGRLLVVEVRRLAARGMTRLLTALGVVLIAVVGVIVFVAVKDADTIRAQVRRDQERIVELCASRPVLPPMRSDGSVLMPSFGDPAEARAQCEEQGARYAEGEVERRTFLLTALAPGWGGQSGEAPPDSLALLGLLNAVVTLPALLLLLGAIAGGASMVGAEWQAGSLVTLLTWEPRRGRLLAARLVASALAGFVLTVALLALFTAVLVLTVSVKGSFAGADHDWWVTYVGVVLRFGGLGALAAATGAALAMIGRRTALAVVAVFAYLIGGEIILSSVWEVSRPWLLLRNVALIVGGTDLVPDGGSPYNGLAVVLAYSAAVVAVALALFRRRDFASSA